MVRSSVVRSSVVHIARQLTPIWLEVRYRVSDIALLSGQISMKLATNICHVSGHCGKVFQGSEVNGQGHDKTKLTYNGGGIHFDCVASRLACFISVIPDSLY